MKEASWYNKLRDDSKQKIQSTPLPSFMHGINIKVEPRYDFESIQFTQSLSKKKTNCEMVQFSTTMPDNEAFMPFSHMEKPENKIDLINSAFANDFVIVHIPKMLTEKKTIEIDYDLVGQLVSKIYILAEQGSKARIVIIKKGKSDYVSDSIKIIAMPDSFVDIVSISEGMNLHMQEREADCRQNAVVNWIDVCLSASFLKTTSTLNGQGSLATTKVFFIGKDENKFDLYTCSHHKAPMTNSRLSTIGILSGKSQALSRGKIRIEQNATGSTGFEKMDTLLLSDEAEADGLPLLEIENNDVKCSHGATIGQVDKEKLFYIMSRGLSHNEAVRKIVEGYFFPLIDSFSDSEIKDRIQAQIEGEINGIDA